MRLRFLVLTVICVLGVLQFAGCQEQEKNAEQSEPKLMEAGIQSAADKDAKQNLFGGEITFETTEHDFGEIGPMSSNHYEFKFKNTGDDILRIKRIQSTCGCTVPKLSKKEYKPGEEGKIEVTYKAGKAPGKAAKNLYVHLFNSKTPKVKLIIKAEIVIKIGFKPKKFNLSLKDENAGCPEVKISSKDDKPFAIKGFKSTNNIIEIDFDPNVTATEFVIQPEVDVEKLKNRLTGRLDIILTHPETSSITIPFEVKTEFVVNPPSIIIFNAEPGQVVKKELWVLSNYDEDFEIESVSSQNNYVKVVSQEKIDNRYKLEVEIIVPEEESKRVFTDIISVNMKGGQQIEVSCRGFYSKTAKVKK